MTTYDKPQYGERIYSGFRGETRPLKFLIHIDGVDVWLDYLTQLTNYSFPYVLFPNRTSKAYWVPGVRKEYQDVLWNHVYERYPNAIAFIRAYHMLQQS